MGQTLPAVRESLIPEAIVKQIAMDIGKEVAAHVARMYPNAVNAASSTFLLSLRNGIYNEIIAALKYSDVKDIQTRLEERKAFRRKINALYKAARKEEQTLEDPDFETDNTVPPNLPDDQKVVVENYVEALKQFKIAKARMDQMMADLALV